MIQSGLSLLYSKGINNSEKVNTDISFPDKTVLDTEIAKVEHQLKSLGIDYTTVKKRRLDNAR